MITEPNYDHDKIEDVEVTEQNLTDYGFACFHEPGAREIEDGIWSRKIELSAKGAPEQMVKIFKVPENLCVELLADQKITDSSHFSINNSAAPAQQIALLAQRAGWNQTPEDLEAMVGVASDGVFIASYRFCNQDIPLGSGVSFPVNDDHCWIGMILVHPELRRQGIARAIMNKCLEQARMVQKKSVIGLDATPLGKQVYDSLGFKDSFTIWRSIISTKIQSPDLSGVRWEPFNLKLVSRYLERKNYTERLHLIKLLSALPGSNSIILSSGEQIIGFVMSRPGRLKPFVGPLIADSHELALMILKKILNYWKDLEHESVLMDIPELHLKDSIFIAEQESVRSDQKIQVQPVRSFMRMYQLVREDEQNKLPIGSAKLSTSESVMEKARDCHDITAAFMEKEKLEIVPIMFGTSGPEWS